MDLSQDNFNDVLETTLIKRIAASEKWQLQQLFSAEDLGDWNPTQPLCGMQQLLSEKAGVMDPSLPRELSFQHLPSNIRMILASTAKRSTLEDLAEMADSVMEVVLLFITTMATPQVTFEVGKLRVEVASLGKQLSVFQVTG